MVKRKNETGEFSGVLALIRRGIRLGNMFVDRVTSLCEETLNDRICGSWIAHEGNRNLLIRKQGSGYTALLCDTSRCYKQIERELYVVFRRGCLTVLSDDGSSGNELFTYDSHTGLLKAGTLGLFEAEDEVLRRAACETDFNRFPYDEI